MIIILILAAIPHTNLFVVDHVWYTEFHARRTQVGDLMAVVDMKLLSMCNETVITHASSFGQVAAALGRTYPYPFCLVGWFARMFVRSFGCCLFAR